MADGNTPNYGFVLVEVGASRDTWGAKLNDNFAAIDTTIKSVSNNIAGKLDASAYTAADVLAKLVGVDGPGSGLDADTVDGLQASAFMLNSSFTPANVLGQLLNADGAGSTLDADTVDGLHANAFAPAAHTHPYLPVDGSGAMTGPLKANGQGVFPHYGSAGMTGGTITVAPASGSDPTGQPGDIWLGY